MKLTVEQINEAIKSVADDDRSKISDGYHTFDELYQHRCSLFVALTNIHPAAWKSLRHSDGSPMPSGWFIAGIGSKPGEQITYHLPNSMWMSCRALLVTSPPEFDGHKSDDVIVRLLNL